MLCFIFCVFHYIPPCDSMLLSSWANGYLLTYLSLAYCVCANFNDKENTSVLFFESKMLKRTACSREIFYDCAIMCNKGPLIGEEVFEGNNNMLHSQTSVLVNPNNKHKDHKGQEAFTCSSISLTLPTFHFNPPTTSPWSGSILIHWPATVFISFSKNNNFTVWVYKLVTNQTLHLLLQTVCSRRVAGDRDVFFVTTVVSAPIVMTTICDTCLPTTALYVVQPNPSSTGTVPVTNEPSAVSAFIVINLERLSQTQ